MLNVSRKYQLNKKLWSFNFGCLLAYSFLWLIGIAELMPVPEVLHPHSNFIVNYYPGVVLALCSMALTFLVIWLMNSFFTICISEHTFWLVLPSVTLVMLTAISAVSSLVQMLSAVIPSLLLLAVVAVFCRLSQQQVKKMR